MTHFTLSDIQESYDNYLSHILTDRCESQHCIAAAILVLADCLSNRPAFTEADAENFGHELAIALRAEPVRIKVEHEP